MSKAAETMIYRRAAICVLVLALAFVLPRLVDTGEGLAGATGAVMVFLAILVFACIFSVFLLLRTLRAYSDLSTAARIIGIVPGVLLVTGLIVLVGWLRL
jgi:hypothetical protein